MAQLLVACIIGYFFFLYFLPLGEVSRDLLYPESRALPIVGPIIFTATFIVLGIFVSIAVNLLYSLTVMVLTIVIRAALFALNATVR